MAPEGIPLWDTVTHPFANVLDFAFGCRHRKLSRVFTLDGHTYKVCCECGTQFEYSLQTMSLVPNHNKLFPALRRLRAGRIYRRRGQRRVASSS
ncbi:MAG TPA: hypothetical protein VGK96_02370 [Candidatus Sulfotelmatobacter sp.]|jgi:hypothetical protein